MTTILKLLTLFAHPRKGEFDQVGGQADSEVVQREGGRQERENPATLSLVFEDRKFGSGSGFRPELPPCSRVPDADDDGRVEVGRGHRHNPDPASRKIAYGKKLS